MILRKTNPIYLLYFGVFLFFSLLQGCSSVAKETKPEQVSRIEIGKSTKEDVLATLGLPHKREIKILEGDKKIEFWIYYKGSGRSTIFTPMLGTVEPTPGRPGYIGVYFTNIQDIERENIAAILVFDDRGLVVDLKTKGE